MTMDGADWWFLQTKDVCNTKINRSILDIHMNVYRNINNTHAFGMMCSREKYLAVYFRSGDVMNGTFDREGKFWNANEKIHPKYGQPSISNYMKCFESNKKNISKVIIVREDQLNPVGNTFESLMHVMHQNVTVINGTYSEAVKWLACAQIVCLGKATTTLAVWGHKNQKIVKLPPFHKHWNNSARQRLELSMF